MMATLYLVSIVIFGISLSSASSGTSGPDLWRKVAKDNVEKYLNMQPNTRKAKNIVLMIGDGMGTSTITAARILKGQMKGEPGEGTQLNFEKLPYTGLSKVYSVDQQVPDSAATMAAIITGVKTKNKCLGVDERATPNQCHDYKDHFVSNIRDWCEAAGKASGFVTTSRVTHATPAALYAATSNRDWERSTSNNAICMDIASQLVYNATNIRVILGGGSKNLIPDNAVDPTTGQNGRRTDGKNLLEEWVNEKKNRNVNHQVVHNKYQLQNVDTDSTDYLMGLFKSDHMSFEIERDKGPNGEPSLAEMTRTAINMLSRNDKGYFLMVEGARIDHAHHEVRARKSLTEAIAFDDAVETVMSMTNESETLIIVTADHSHPMTLAGYPARGNGILDIVKDENKNPVPARDGLPFTTLMYAIGPSEEHPRPDLTNVDTESNTFRQNTAVKFGYGLHSGEDVAIYARGPMAHLLTGVKEQNVIAYVMAHAACVGNIGIPCDSGR